MQNIELVDHRLKQLEDGHKEIIKHLNEYSTAVC